MTRWSSPIVPAEHQICRCCAGHPLPGAGVERYSRAVKDEPVALENTGSYRLAVDHASRALGTRGRCGAGDVPVDYHLRRRAVPGGNLAKDTTHTLAGMDNPLGVPKFTGGVGVGSHREQEHERGETTADV